MNPIRIKVLLKNTKLRIEIRLSPKEKELDLKTQGEYGGRRIVFRAGIGSILKDIRRAQLVNLDIGVGDPIVPGPIKNTLSEMLGGGSISWNVYPIETSAVEKIHTLVVRGSNSLTSNRGGEI